MNGKYSPTIGLEIHAELKTRTKMFCGSLNDSEEVEPNKNICPICMAEPGTLPTINKQAVKSILKVGLSVGGRLADYSEFDRKNYFYPDIPKGYQISQYKYPLVSGGELSGVKITRIHLEEDTASSQHVTIKPSPRAKPATGHSNKQLTENSGSDVSLVDFNRAGVPLMELVTEPVIRSSEEAVNFAKELQTLLRYLDVSDAEMEKGQMRIEANISVAKDGSRGTKVEVKNLNSFRSVERAIKFEIERQSELLERGETILQETRGWNESRQITFSQRKKEESHDYRYFPEPDLPKLFINDVPEFETSVLRSELPELPWQKRERFSTLGLRGELVHVFVRDRHAGDFIDSVLTYMDGDKNLLTTAINIISSSPINFSEANKPGRVVSFVKLVKMRNENKISNLAVQSILEELIKNAGDPEEIAKREGLIQENDESKLLDIVRTVIKNHPEIVKEYRAGKTASLQYLIGQGMKETKGSANPKILKEIFEKEIG